MKIYEAQDNHGSTIGYFDNEQLGREIISAMPGGVLLEYEVNALFATAKFTHDVWEKCMEILNKRKE